MCNCSKIAEMEKEVAYLRSLLGMTSNNSSPSVPQGSQFSPNAQISQPLLDASASAISSFSTSQPIPNGLNSALASQQPANPEDMQLTSLLTDMRNERRSAKPAIVPKDSQTLEDVMLTKEQIDELFELFVAYSYFNPISIVY